MKTNHSVNGVPGQIFMETDEPSRRVAVWESEFRLTPFDKQAQARLPHAIRVLITKDEGLRLDIQIRAAAVIKMFDTWYLFPELTFLKGLHGISAEALETYQRKIPKLLKALAGSFAPYEKVIPNTWTLDHRSLDVYGEVLHYPEYYDLDDCDSDYTIRTVGSEPPPSQVTVRWEPKTETIYPKSRLLVEREFEQIGQALGCSNLTLENYKDAIAKREQEFKLALEMLDVQL